MGRIQALEAQARSGAKAVEDYVRGPLHLKALAWKGNIQNLALLQR